MLISKSQVKYIQSLSHKKFRDEAGVFVAEGPKIVGELLRVPGMRCRQVYAMREWIEGTEGMGGGTGAPTGGADAGAVRVQEVSGAELERLSALATANQVLAVFEKPVYPPPDFNNGITLVLDGSRDLYTMERTEHGWVVIGNESKGIRPGLLELATDRVTIPGAGHAESLNAAVAAGIVLSHLVK